jgi:hypothetical protein
MFAVINNWLDSCLIFIRKQRLCAPKLFSEKKRLQRQREKFAKRRIVSVFSGDRMASSKL